MIEIKSYVINNTRLICSTFWLDYLNASLETCQGCRTFGGQILARIVVHCHSGEIDSRTAKAFQRQMFPAHCKYSRVIPYADMTNLTGETGLKNFHLHEQFSVPSTPLPLWMNFLFTTFTESLEEHIPTRNRMGQTIHCSPLNKYHLTATVLFLHRRYL